MELVNINGRMDEGLANILSILGPMGPSST